MSRPYAPKSFFRAVPGKLLEQYFRERDVLEDVPFPELTQRNIEPLFNSWLALPNEKREELEADFRDIHALASVRGFDAIVDEARWPGHNRSEDHDIRQQLAEMASPHDRAMWTFLNRPEYWKGALRFSAADLISTTFWVERKNIPMVDARVDKASIEQLGKALGQYFYVIQGRGQNCAVDPLRRRNIDYYFCFPEDYSQANPEWVDGDLCRRPASPAFDLIFVYSKQEGKLRTYIRGGKKPVPDLQDIFAQIILGCKELPEDEEDKRIYDLRAFSSGPVAFQVDPDSGIKSATVEKLRLSMRYDGRRRYWLDADTRSEPELIYAMLERFSREFPLDEFDVTRVELKVVFAATRERGRRTLRPAITLPNRCTLGFDGDDLIVRRMLVDTGIEPEEPGANGGS